VREKESTTCYESGRRWPVAQNEIALSVQIIHTRAAVFYKQLFQIDWPVSIKIHKSCELMAKNAAAPLFALQRSMREARNKLIIIFYRTELELCTKKLLGQSDPSNSFGSGRHQ
jgi:hypothetical protein